MAINDRRHGWDGGTATRNRCPSPTGVEAASRNGERCSPLRAQRRDDGPGKNPSHPNRVSNRNLKHTTIFNFPFSILNSRPGGCRPLRGMANSVRRYGMGSGTGNPSPTGQRQGGDAKPVRGPYGRNSGTSPVTCHLSLFTFHLSPVTCPQRGRREDPSTGLEAGPPPLQAGEVCLVPGARCLVRVRDRPLRGMANGVRRYGRVR